MKSKTNRNLVCFIVVFCVAKLNWHFNLTQPSDKDRLKATPAKYTTLYCSAVQCITQFLKVVYWIITLTVLTIRSMVFSSTSSAPTKVAFSSLYSSKTNIINWVMSVPWLESGSTGKYQHSVKGFPRAAPSGTPLTSCWYFPVLPSSRLGTDTVLYRLYTVQPSTVEAQYSTSLYCRGYIQ